MDGVHDKVMAFPSSKVTDENDLVRFKTKNRFKFNVICKLVYVYSTYFSLNFKLNFNIQYCYIICIYKNILTINMNFFKYT